MIILKWTQCTLVYDYTEIDTMHVCKVLHNGVRLKLIIVFLFRSNH